MHGSASRWALTPSPVTITPSGPGGNDNAGRLARGIPQELGGIAPEEERHLGLDERLVQGAFHLHGGGEHGGLLPCHGRFTGRRTLDDNLTQQKPARFRTVLHLKLKVARLGADRAGKDERVPFERPIPNTRVRDHACRGPFLAIAADRHGHARDVKLRRALIRHHVHFPNLLLRTQIEHQRDVAVVLNALAGCALPLPIVQQRLRLGVAMLCGGRPVGGILEGQAASNRGGWRRARLEHLARQIRGRRFARLEPKPVSCAQILPQIRPRSGQEHLRTGSGRLHRRGDATRPATHNDYIHFVQDRK